MRRKFRLKETKVFACDSGTEQIPKDTPAVVVKVDERKSRVLIDFGMGRCGWFSQSVLDSFQPIDGNELIREALKLAEANAGMLCPLSSDACGEYFEQIRDLLRKVVSE